MVKLKEYSLEKIKEIISFEKDFRDLNSWKFEHIPLGEMEHTYKLSKGNKKYFLKELKPHEAQMEYFLVKLRLRDLPFSLYPKLLKQKILIRRFIVGRMLRSKNIDLKLIKDFVNMRNKMNDKKYFDKYNILKLNNYSQKDNGFYEKDLEGSFSKAMSVLNKLNKYHLNEVENVKRILNYLKGNKKSINKDFVNMPFAKQHQDFREDNIIIEKGRHKLIDWGSAYGYNPFMYDVAPFLINNAQALKIYVKNSKNCKGVSKEQISRWLYVALAARFLDIIMSRLHFSENRTNTKADCKKYLAYEYKTYKKLLDC